MSLLTSLGLVSMVFVIIFTWWTYAAADHGSGQSKRASIVEAWVNILIGFGINFAANMLLLPLVGARFTLMENFWMGSVYTSLSILRSYAIRRWFNDRIHAFATRAARSLS